MIKKLLFPTVAFAALAIAVVATPQQGRAAYHCSDSTCPQWENEGCDPWTGFHCIDNGPQIACELCL